MTNRIKPKLAARVILLRHAARHRFEVFLTRYPDKMPIIGGHYGYPGGAVCRRDYASSMIERCSGLSPGDAQKILGAHVSPTLALGIWVAAVRQIFEQVGILLAVEVSGAPVAVDSARARRLAQHRQALLNKSLSFRDLLEVEKLLCDLASLRHFSSWLTPALDPVRFDTQMLVALWPTGQAPLAPSHAAGQTTWLTPDRALRQFERGELPLIFPTFAALRRLADFETIESVLREFKLGPVQ